MKFIAILLLTALAGYAVCLYSSMPWWSFAVTSFLIALLIPMKPWQSWLAGFLGLFLLWLGLAWYIDMANQGILSVRIARLLPLNGNRYLLLLVTGFAGGLISSMAALSGSLAARLR
jgi:hypothetical protein